jgi:hypothetical protein
MFDAVSDSDDPDGPLRSGLDIVLDTVVTASKTQPRSAAILLANAVESLAFVEARIGRPASLGLVRVRLDVLRRHLHQ